MRYHRDNYFHLTATIILMLLCGVLVSQFANLASANPFSQSMYKGERAPSSPVEPPIVTVLSPQHNKGYNTHDIALNVNVSTKNSKWVGLGSGHAISGLSIEEIYFIGDWQKNKTVIFSLPLWNDEVKKFSFMGNFYERYDDVPKIDLENFSINLTSVPDGKHSIIVYAVGQGSELYMFEQYSFHVTGHSLGIAFFVDSLPPSIVLSIENKTYLTSEIPLNLTANKPVTQALYTLDTQRNMTLSENTTLTSLVNGPHNITVHVWDSVGNVGVQTVFFSVEKPEPITATSAATVIGVSAAILEAVALVYVLKFKKSRT